MNRARWIGPVIVALAIIGLLVAGCGDDATQPDQIGNGPDSPDLEDPYGGYTTQDELPAFGDNELAESAGNDVPYQDQMAEDPEISGWENASPDSVHAYVVTLLWGQLVEDLSTSREPSEDPDIPESDWSGYLRVNRGGAVLQSVIAFEHGDYIVRPRTDRRVIEWVSHTTVSFDGIRVVLYQPFEGEETGENDSLAVVLGDNRWDFLINDLADYDYTETLDEYDNKFSIKAFLAVPTVCGHGFVGGAWYDPATPDERGTFRGRWVSRDGTVTGFVRGHFGVNAHGRNVLFGKYIDESGRFRGVLRGTWERVGSESIPGMSDRHRTHGWYRAEWVDAGGTVVGNVHGHWRSVPGLGRGFFDGVWKAVCLKP